MDQPQLTRTDVIQAIENSAGIQNAAEVMPYIGGADNPYRGRVMAAIAAGDGHALGTYCAHAVNAALSRAGFKTALDARALKALSAAPDGWPMLHDTAGERENAAAHLDQRIKAFRQRNGQADDVPDAAHGRDMQRPVPAQRTSRPQPPPPRRHDNSTVRHIGEARRAREQTQADEARDRNSSEVTWDSVKVHGGRAALTLEASTTRRHDEPTINIEAAKLLDQQARTYDWQNKIIVQLTTTELQQVTCLLYGMIDRVKFQNHGPQNDKWFEIERQSGQYAGTTKFAVGQGKEMCLVQLTAADLGNVLALFIRQCARQMKIDQSALYTALRPVAQAIHDYTSRRGGARQAAG